MGMLSIPGSIPAAYTISGTGGSVAALVLEAEWSRVWEIPLVLTTWNCGIAQGSGGTRPRILLTTL